MRSSFLGFFPAALALSVGACADRTDAEDPEPTTETEGASTGSDPVTDPGPAPGTTGGPSTTGVVDDGADSSSGEPERPDDGLWPHGFTFVEVPGVQANWIEFGDFNGDGIQDVLASGPDGTTVHVGDGLGAFEEVSQTATTGYHFARVGDFDGDGDLDAAAFDDYSRDVFRLIENDDGLGTMSLHVVSLGGFFGFGVAPLHLDDDQAHDLFVPQGHSLGGMLAYSNGDRTFTEGPMVMGAGCYFSNVGVGDFDGDGLDDVAGTGSCNSVPDFLPLVIYRHLEEGFGPAQAIHADLGGVIEGGQVRVVDIDHDGDLDVVTLGELGVYVVHNLGGGVFEDPPARVPHTWDEYAQTVVPIELGPDAAPAFVLDSRFDDISIAALVVPEADLSSSTTELIDIYGRIAGTADVNGDGAPDVAVLMGGDEGEAATLGVWLSGG